MTDTSVVPLIRHFAPVPKDSDTAEENASRTLWGLTKPKGWDDLVAEYRTVILADAGAGKTFEMLTQARKLREQGKAAFFIRIEDIGDRFDGAFEVGNAGEFAAWLQSTSEGWFFLDSVDESRLDNPRKFEIAIKRFAARIHAAIARAHVCITSRPYAWRSVTDPKIIEQNFPFEPPKTERTGENESENSANGGNADDAEQDAALKIYWLSPLNKDDIRHFADHKGAVDSDALLSAIERANLWSMAERPFDLDDLLAKWAIDQCLGGRLDILRHGISLRLQEIDPDRADRQPLSLERALAGARLLAAAVTFTKQPGIRVPEGLQNKSGIDAQVILAGWQPDEVKALLARGIFNDAIYGAVRFRHREVRELLTAEWMRDLLPHGRHKVEALIFGEQYGENVIRPTLRPILPWLVLFDQPVRSRALALHPEIAVEGGDAAGLPYAERRTILRDIVARIVANTDDRSGRDNAAIARIAQHDLTDDALALIEKHRENDDAIFFLGRLVWQGGMANCVAPLLSIATNAERGIYARIASVRAASTVGTSAQCAEIWRALIANDAPFERRLLAELLGEAKPEGLTVELLLQSIKRLPPYERFEATGLKEATHQFIERLPVQLLPPLVEGLNTYLDQKPHLERRECHVSKDYLWLIGPAMHVVERLVSARDVSSQAEAATAILLNVPAVRFWRDGDYEEHKTNLSELIPNWIELNDGLFWASVREARTSLKRKKSERLTDDWSVSWIGHYWRFDASSFDRVIDYVRDRPLRDDQLVALSLAFRIYAQNDRPVAWLDQLKVAAATHAELGGTLNTLLNPPVSEQTQEWQREQKEYQKKRDRNDRKQEKDRAKWIAKLRANPNTVRNPPGLKPGQFSNDQYWLLGEIEGKGLRKSRGQGADWETLIPEFGAEVAAAYRDAALAHWRNYMPGLRSEGADTGSIPYALIFAMAGLAIEAHEAANFPQNLTNEEITLAYRYITKELNGFPEWLGPLYNAFPKQGFEAIWRELIWELENSKPDQAMHYILHDLVYYAPWLHSRLAPSIHDWLRINEAPNWDSLRYCLYILIGGSVAGAGLAELARSKIVDSTTADHLPNWYALWVDSDPNNAIPALTAKLNGQKPADASLFAQKFITALMGERRGNGPSLGAYRTATHLKSLYALMHRFIKSQEDIQRAGKGVYSPELRDDAQDARNRLFNLLTEIPGKAVYTALIELTRDHPDPSYHHWMRVRARERAIEDSDLEAWEPNQVSDFASGLEIAPATHRQLFDLTVSRLIDFKNWLEGGNDSLAATYAKADSEAEMRNVVANWLNTHAKGRYTCAQEAELANAQRPDIWVQHVGIASAVPIELKLLDKSWSGPKLCERLRNQLAGDYLREASAGCGVMLLVSRGKEANRRWRIAGKTVPLAEVANALTAYWNGIAPEFPSVESIKIMSVDLAARSKRSQIGL